jgi:hypothetical protein
VTFVVLMALKLTCKIRITAEEEEIGQDAFFMEQISQGGANNLPAGDLSGKSRGDDRNTVGDAGDDGGSHTEKAEKGEKED